MISGFEIGKSKQSGGKQGRANECQTIISAESKEVNTGARKILGGESAA